MDMLKVSCEGDLFVVHVSGNLKGRAIFLNKTTVIVASDYKEGKDAHKVTWKY